jgi:isoleucyl-tRNA synthetase
MVSFPIIGDPDNAAFVAWTTTPWTLPSNLALCVNANLMYAKVLFLFVPYFFHYAILFMFSVYYAVC